MSDQLKDKPDDGGAAFPEWKGWREGDIWEVDAGGGITYLDYMAGQALAGGMLVDIIKLLTKEEPDAFGGQTIQTGVAVTAYSLADAMLAEKRRREDA